MDEDEFYSLLDKLSSMDPPQLEVFFTRLHEHFEELGDDDSGINNDALAWRIKQSLEIVKHRKKTNE